MDEQKRKEFEEAVKPMHDWLCKYGHPHMVVVVEQAGAQVYEGIAGKTMGVPD